MTEHKLKTWVRFWDAVASGEKTFEVRKNDRAFQTGDVLVLQKFDPETGGYVRKDTLPGTPPETIRKRVTFLLQGGMFGVEPGYCVLGLGEPQT